MRATELMIRHVAPMAAFGALALIACSDDGSSTPDASDTTDTTDTADSENAGDTVTPSSGRVLLTSTAIRGWQGKVLLATGPGGRSRVCHVIDADPFTLPPTALSDMPADNPCGPTTADTLFEPGKMLITVVVITPGSQTPEATTVVEATVVDGDVTVTIDGGALAPATGDPGKVTVSSSPIRGRSGKILIVSSQSAGARLCAAIDADPFTLAPAVMNALGDNPCAPPGAEVTFQPGVYLLSAGIYTPGNQQPDVSIDVPITVDGDTAVTLDGDALSP